jgi:hypothetical protein
MTVCTEKLAADEGVLELALFVVFRSGLDSYVVDQLGESFSIDAALKLQFHEFRVGASDFNENVVIIQHFF